MIQELAPEQLGGEKVIIPQNVIRVVWPIPTIHEASAARIFIVTVG